MPFQMVVMVEQLVLLNYHSKKSNLNHFKNLQPVGESNSCCQDENLESYPLDERAKICNSLKNLKAKFIETTNGGQLLLVVEANYLLYQEYQAADHSDEVHQ